MGQRASTSEKPADEQVTEHTTDKLMPLFEDQSQAGDTLLRRTSSSSELVFRRPVARGRGITRRFASQDSITPQDLSPGGSENSLASSSSSIESQKSLDSRLHRAVTGTTNAYKKKVFKSAIPIRIPTSHASDSLRRGSSSSVPDLSKAHVKQKQADIVAAVTQRLYPKKKPPSATGNGANGEHSKDGTASPTPEPCTRGRLRLFDLSKRLLNAQRNKELIAKAEAETQTEKDKNETKEAAVGTEKTLPEPIHAFITSEVFLPSLLLHPCNLVSPCEGATCGGAGVQPDLLTSRTCPHECSASPLSRSVSVELPPCCDDECFSDDSLEGKRDVDSDSLDGQVDKPCLWKVVHLSSGQDFLGSETQQVAENQNLIPEQTISANVTNNNNSVVIKGDMPLEENWEVNVLIGDDSDLENTSVNFKISNNNNDEVTDCTLFNGLALSSEDSEPSRAASSDDNNSCPSPISSDAASTASDSSSGDDFVYFLQAPEEANERRLYTIAENSEHSDHSESLEPSLSPPLHVPVPSTGNNQNVDEEVIHLDSPISKTQSNFSIENIFSKYSTSNSVPFPLNITAAPDQVQSYSSRSFYPEFTKGLTSVTQAAQTVLTSSLVAPLSSTRPGDPMSTNMDDHNTMTSPANPFSGSMTHNSTNTVTSENLPLNQLGNSIVNNSNNTGKQNTMTHSGIPEIHLGSSGAHNSTSTGDYNISTLTNVPVNHSNSSAIYNSSNHGDQSPITHSGMPVNHLNNSGVHNTGDYNTSTREKLPENHLNNSGAYNSTNTVPGTYSGVPTNHFSTPVTHNLTHTGDYNSETHHGDILNHSGNSNLTHTNNSNFKNSPPHPNDPLASVFVPLHSPTLVSRSRSPNLLSAPTQSIPHSNPINVPHHEKLSSSPNLINLNTPSPELMKFSQPDLTLRESPQNIDHHKPYNDLLSYENKPETLSFGAHSLGDDTRSTVHENKASDWSKNKQEDTWSQRQSFSIDSANLFTNSSSVSSQPFTMTPTNMFSNAQASSQPFSLDSSNLFSNNQGSGHMLPAFSNSQNSNQPFSLTSANVFSNSEGTNHTAPLNRFSNGQSSNQPYSIDSSNLFSNIPSSNQTPRQQAEITSRATTASTHNTGAIPRVNRDVSSNSTWQARDQQNTSSSTAFQLSDSKFKMQQQTAERRAPSSSNNGSRPEPGVQWADPRQRHFLNVSVVGRGQNQQQQQQAPVSTASEDSITFVYVGPARKHAPPVLLELVRRSVGGRGLQRSVSLDSATRALSRLTQRRRDVVRACSVDTLVPEETHAFLEPARRAQHGPQARRRREFSPSDSEVRSTDDDFEDSPPPELPRVTGQAVPEERARPWQDMKGLILGQQPRPQTSPSPPPRPRTVGKKAVSWSDVSGCGVLSSPSSHSLPSPTFSGSPKPIIKKSTLTPVPQSPLPSPPLRSPHSPPSDHSARRDRLHLDLHDSWGNKAQLDVRESPPWGNRLQDAYRRSPDYRQQGARLSPDSHAHCSRRDCDASRLSPDTHAQCSRNDFDWRRERSVSAPSSPYRDPWPYTRLREERSCSPDCQRTEWTRERPSSWHIRGTDYQRDFRGASQSAPSTPLSSSPGSLPRFCRSRSPPRCGSPRCHSLGDVSELGRDAESLRLFLAEATTLLHSLSDLSRFLEQQPSSSSKERGVQTERPTPHTCCPCPKADSNPERRLGRPACRTEPIPIQPHCCHVPQHCCCCSPRVSPRSWYEPSVLERQLEASCARLEASLQQPPEWQDLCAEVQPGRPRAGHPTRPAAASWNATPPISLPPLPARTSRPHYSPRAYMRHLLGVRRRIIQASRGQDTPPDDG